MGRAGSCYATLELEPSVSFVKKSTLLVSCILTNNVIFLVTQVFAIPLVKMQLNLI